MTAHRDKPISSTDLVTSPTQAVLVLLAVSRSAVRWSPPAAARRSGTSRHADCRLLASPAASAIPGIVSGSSSGSGCSSAVEGVLLPRLLDGVPAPPSSPYRSTGSSSSAFKYPEAVEEQYQKMLKSVEAKTMPPNAWLWLMISSCTNKEDIKFLFQILQKLRFFRLSNLRINANFKDHLCMKVTEACARVGALDYGLKALQKHNVYGITPTIGSSHYLLQHAKEHNDTKLMERVMQVLSRNSLPLQPGTADIVFSICYNADRWDLLSKYAELFVKAGVKLHRTAFDICMEFAAKVGDSQAIWSINSLRGKSVKYYTLATGFACAKGFLLEHRPESAAAIIKLLNKHLPEQKKAFIKDELQKLIAEWPSEVIKRQNKNDRKALEEALVRNIPTMINCLKNLGLDLPVDLDELTPQLQAAW